MTRALLLAGVFGLGACAANGNLPPVAAAHANVVQSVDSGVRASMNHTAVTVPVRLNPADCECPKWEVHAFGRWTRVFLDGDLAPLAPLETATDPLARATITGRFAEQTRLSERQVRYPVFVLSQ